MFLLLLFVYFVLSPRLVLFFLSLVVDFTIRSTNFHLQVGKYMYKCCHVATACEGLVYDTNSLAETLDIGRRTDEDRDRYNYRYK